MGFLPSAFPFLAFFSAGSWAPAGAVARATEGSTVDGTVDGVEDGDKTVVGWAADGFEDDDATVPDGEGNAMVNLAKASSAPVLALEEDALAAPALGIVGRTGSSTSVSDSPNIRILCVLI